MNKISKILCAVDLSQHSDVVAEYAKMFATSFDAEIVAVYAAPELAQYVGLHVPPSSLEGAVEEIVEGAEKGMQEFIANTFKGYRATGKVLHGYAAEKILEAAEIERADIIIMGTHGRKGLDRFLFGSVAERVVKSAKQPVMTVRPKELT